VSILVGYYPFIELLISLDCNMLDGQPYHDCLDLLVPARAEGEDEKVEFLLKTLNTILNSSGGKRETAVNEEFQGETPLTLGIKNDARTFVSQLLNMPALDINLLAPLQVALEEVNKLRVEEFGDQEMDQLMEERRQFLFSVITRLIDRNASLQLGSQNALIMAIDTGRVDLVRRMIDSGADLNFMCPLAHCLEVFTQPRAEEDRRQAMEKMAMVLLENGCDPNAGRVGPDQEPALDVAIKAQRVNLAKLLARSGTTGKTNGTNPETGEPMDNSLLRLEDQEGNPLIFSLLKRLLVASKAGDAAKVEVLQEVLVEVITNSPESTLNSEHDGFAPLDLALKCDNARVTDNLLELGAKFGPSALNDCLKELCDPDTEDDRKEFLDKMSVTLIKNGADVNQACQGVTPMDMALNFGSLPVVSTLIENGVNLKAVNSNGLTPPAVVATELGDPRLENEMGSERLEFLECAAAAMSESCPEILMDILDTCGSRPVGQQITLDLIENHNINTKAVRDSDNSTALHAAAKAGALPVVRAIVLRGTNINICTKFMQTPLMFAAYGGHTGVVDFLVSQEADMGQQGGQYLPRMTALHEACLRGSANVVKILVQAGAPVDARAYWERTPMHFAVFGGDASDEEGRLACVEQLIAGGADVNLMDIEGETGLSYAVERGYQAISDILLSNGADPCGPDVHGTTPMHHCIERSNSELFNMLLQSNPEQVETLGLLPWAVRAGYMEGVDTLTQPAGIVSVADVESHIIGQAFIGGWMCPLWNAAYFNQIGDGYSLAEVFLTQTQDLDVKDITGTTLLHRLVHWGGPNQTRFITTMLKAGADPNIKDDQFFTPLMQAVRIGNEAAAKALLNGGAEVTAEDVEASVARGDPGAGVLLSLGLTGAGPKQVPRCDASSAESVIAWCKETGLKFVDPDFPPCLVSLSGDVNAADTAGRYHDVEWLRAAENSAGVLLGPNDAVCGQLGDPFFVATLPDNPIPAFGDITKCAEGVYEVNVNGTTVVIDDFVPSFDGQPEFTKSASGLMWPLLYEKAMAKLAGCYDALSTIRRGGHIKGSRNVEDIALPEDVCTSARREYAIREYLDSAISAAALSGHDGDLEEFAAFFKETEKPAKYLDGEAHAMSSVGAYEQFSFPLRAPAISVKINDNTNIHVECARDPKCAEGKMVVCVAEVTPVSWRMVGGKVCNDGEVSVELDIYLRATGNPYVVFVGTPVSDAAVADVTLDIASDINCEVDKY